MDDLAGAVAEQVGTEDVAALFVDQHLGEGSRLGVGLGRALAGHVVQFDLDLMARGMYRLLGETDRGKRRHRLSGGH